MAVSKHQNQAISQSVSFLLAADSETVGFRRAVIDEALLKDERVLQTMLKLEECNLPTDYLSKAYQRDVKAHMRKIVATWMLEVCEEQHCEEDVFLLAISYVDRFLSLVDVPRAQLQLLATTAMFVSSKLKETCPLSARKLVTYTDNSITIDQLLYWETLLLNKLKWDVCTVTPNDFLDYVIYRLKSLDDAARRVIRGHAQTFIALCATDVELMRCPPSMVAAGCIGAAAVGYRGLQWCNDVRLMAQLHTITHIEVDFIDQCRLQVEQTLASCLPQSPSSASTSSESGMSTPEKNPSLQQQHPATPTDVRDVALS